MGSRAELYARLPRQPGDAWWSELARASSDGRVVEFGAGTGRLTSVFLDAGARVTAVDRDPAMVAALREGFDRHRDLEVVAAEVTTLPRGPRAGLVALPASLLNELPDARARRAALASAAGRCRDDGRVALHLLSPWWLVGLDGRSSGVLAADDGVGQVEVVVEAGGFAPWAARRRARLTYRFDDGTVLEDQLDAAVITPGELEGAIEAAGLELLAAFGAVPPAAVAEGDVSWHLLLRPLGCERGQGVERSIGASAASGMTASSGTIDQA